MPRQRRCEGWRQGDAGAKNIDDNAIVDRVASLADRLLEDGYAVGLDLFAFRLLGFALDPKFVFLNQVELLGLPIDGIHDRRRQVGC